MAQIIHELVIRADVARPVPEMCQIIGSFLRIHPTNQLEILQMLRKAIDEEIGKLEGGVQCPTDTAT
jgi:hypothetical protein